MDNNELEIQEAEFTQDKEQLAAIAEQKSELVEYVPKSKAPYRMDTLIPRNIAFEVQKSLNGIIQEKGNIDNLIRNELKYTTTEEMWKGLGAEQVDGVALYLKQFYKQEGIIIADQTGIGKGRQAAAVIRHAVKNDYLPIFFTKKPDLFSDMYRDLKAIGLEDIHPFIVNTDSHASVKDADGSVVHTPMDSKSQYNYLTVEKTFPTESPEGIEWYKKIGKQLPDPEKHPTVTIVETKDHLPIEYDMIFCTYSQIQAAHPYKRLFISQITENGIAGSKKFKKVVFILDESHMAGGFDSIIGNWMRNILPHTQACCYLSATFAKTPEVTPLYAKKTAIQEAQMEEGAFVRSMISGGLALQEIVVSNLAESGQLIRRQRSNEGVKVDYITLDQEPERSKNRASVDRIVKLMNEVVQFEQDYVSPALGIIHAEAKRHGEGMKERPKGLGVKQSPYFSRVFNIVDQMLFALKVEDVANHTIKLLNENKKVVIAFKSTMGAFLKEMDLVSGDVIAADKMDFTRTLVRGLDGIFKYSYTEIDGKKSRMTLPLDDLPQSGIDMYNNIKKKMLQESSGLSISPIDQLIHIIEKANKGERLGGHTDKTFKVAEVTGRNQRITFEGGDGIVNSFKSNTEKSFRLFNSGEYDVLLINQSGSTGSSAHASKDFSDQRQRAMIIHQFELDINTEIQKRGRINRTGQVVKPEYYYITSDIPAEKRLMTMLKAKLKSLDANTTGSQKTSEDSLKSADFLNKYGDKVAWKWIDDNQDMMDKLGHPTYHKVTDKKTGRVSYERNESNEGAISQVTGRAGLLLVKDQEALYNDLLERYDHQIKLEKQQGTYDLETEFLKLDADVKKRFLHQKGIGGKTPFGKDTVRDETIVNNLNRPFTKQELDERITTVLDGKKASQVRVDLVNEINEYYPQLIEERKSSRLETIANLQKELEAMPDNGSGENEEENEKIVKQKEHIQELINEKSQSLSSYIKKLEHVKQQIVKYINFWLIGDVVKVPFYASEIEPSWGMFMGVSVGKVTNNPYTLGNISLKFAVIDARKTISHSLQDYEQESISKIYTESKDISDDDKLMVNADWNNLIQEASSKRQKRHILTENIVAAATYIGAQNKLIKYNTEQGTIKNGILLHTEYGKDGEGRIALIPISEGYNIVSKLAIDTIFSDHQAGVKLKRTGQNEYNLFIHKKEHFRLYTDAKLRSLIQPAQGQSEDELPDFVQNAGDMTAVLHINNLQPFLDRLSEFGLKYEGAAKELEDWEIENTEDWKSKTTTTNTTYTYQLGRAYGQGSNPTVGFINYKEPTAEYPFGIVIYNRKLNDKERYNYSLIPIFNTVEEPYQAWKSVTMGSGLKADFENVVKKAKQESLYDAFSTLGYFITNHPHEDGNTEFVFGTYAPEVLGRAFYEDMIEQITPIDELIIQLNIELETA